MSLASGTTVAGYRVDALLGRGGMGEVYRAVDERLGRPVALKLVAPELTQAPGIRERFLAESRLAASLDHPHIVPIYEAGEAGGRLFLAMRFVDGADLEAIITRDGPLEPVRALALLRGIAEALDAAHDRGLVHRDVKPSNILVARTVRGEEHAYLGDFGLVKQLGTEAGYTVSGQLLGSVDYVAPEQIEGRPIDGRVDVYSLACVLYAGLTGGVPYPRESDMATLWAHVQTPPPRPSDIDATLAPLDPIIARGMAKSPEDRPASAGELLRAAEAVIDADRPRLAKVIGKAEVELPYLGLRAFDEADARFYVGRENDIESLVERLRGDRFLAVFGPSGSGKSSLVRAGLVPSLRQGAIPSSETWRVEVLRPGALPLEAVAARLVQLAPSMVMGPTVDSLASDSRTLHHATELALASAPDGARVLWVIDQAEELFSLCSDEDARRATIDNLVHAATVPGGRTLVVLAMRADFYHRCAAYPPLAAAVAQSQFLVSPLSEESLRRTIEEPARVVGLELEPGLVDTILGDVADRPGALPLLEHLLFELWDRRDGATLTLAGYRACGGIEGAIAVRAEVAYWTFDEADRVIARRVLLRLVQPGQGTEDTRRRVAVHELDDGTNVGEAGGVVDALAAGRLITLGRAEANGEPVVDLAHEALLRAWPRLREWIEEDREALRIARRIGEANADWTRLGHEREQLLQGARLAEAAEFVRDGRLLLTDAERAFVETSIADLERRTLDRKRRGRIGLGVAAGLAVFFFALSGLAWSLWMDAEDRGAVAEAARVEALGRQLVAQSLATRDDLGLSTLLALEGLRRFESAEARENLTGALNRLPEIETFRKIEGFIRELAASPDGRRLAVLFGGGEDAEAATISILDAGTWRTTHGPIETFEQFTGSGAPHHAHLGFSPGGERLAYVAADGAVAVLDLASGGVQRSVPVSEEIDSVVWDSAGTLVRWIGHDTAGDDRPRLWTWDPATGDSSYVDIIPDYPVGEGFFSMRRGYLSPGARWAVTVDNDARSTLFEAATGKPRGTLEAGVVGFDQDGEFLAARTASGVQVYTIPELSAVGSEVRPVGATYWAEVGPDATRLYVWSDGRTMSTFDVESGFSLVEPVAAPATHLATMAVAGGDQRFVAQDDGTVAIVDVDRDVRLQVPGSDARSVDGTQQTVLSTDGAMMANWSAISGTPARTVSVRDLASDRLIGEVRPDEPSGVFNVAFSADGRSLVTLHDSGRLVSTVISGGATTVLGTFQIDAGGGTTQIVVSADGRLIALVQDQRTTVLDEAGASRSLPVGGFGADFLPDGSTILVSACNDQTIRFVDVASGSVTSELAVDGCPTNIDVDAGGSRLLVNNIIGVNAQSVLELYDLPAGGHLGTVVTGARQALDARFLKATNGATAVTVSTGNADDYEIRDWDVDPASWTQRACALAGRNLTRTEWARYLDPEPYRKTCSEFSAAIQLVPEPSAMPSPSPAASAPSGDPTLCDTDFFGGICYQRPGHYVVDTFTPRVTFDLDDGWYNNGSSNSLIAFVRDEGEFLEIARDVHEVFDDSGAKTSIGTTPDAFLAWLRSRRDLEVGESGTATLGALPAAQVDVTVIRDTKLFTYVDQDAEYGAAIGQRIRFILATVNGSLIHVAVEAPASSFDAFWAFASPVVESLAFE